jgi:CTP synthase
MATKKKTKTPHKYIFVLGGVMSGIGKGITTSSVGTILQAKGFRVNLIKVDPYLNVDAGTMNPTEHGEVFVLDSGLETDQDMGNYERFLNQSASGDDYITSGMVYQTVIERERNLGYDGKCVEAVPDIVNEITDRITRAEREKRSDITVVEMGGTIGDYQNSMFIESARLLSLARYGDVAFVLVSYVPFPQKIGEPKTRPTRIASQTLNSYGVQADVIIARSEVDLDEKRLKKLALSCSVLQENVISAPDIDSIYDVPLNFEKGHIGSILMKRLSLPKKKEKGMSEWKRFVARKNTTKKEIRIALVGKYFDTGSYTLADSYISVIEALKAAAYAEGVEPVLEWVNSKKFEKKGARFAELKKYDGILVPGGFGTTGIEGKIKVIEYARKNKIPYFGLCYGMQLAVVEYARHKAGIPRAQTAEINPNGTDVVIDVMPEQKEKIRDKKYGGTMRLGTYPAKLKLGSIARKAYKKSTIHERHRHRYEVNPGYIEKLQDAGLIFSGTSPDGRLMEIVELPKKEHPFFVATQFHPEFLSRPLAPHPLFVEFVRAMKK